jgi:hypothetical protein
VLATVQRWHVVAPSSFLLLLLAVITWAAVHTAPRADASNDHRAAQFAARVLELAPPGALVVTASDRDSFSLWYYHFALGQRPDIVVAVAPLLRFEWYRENIRARYTALRVPQQSRSDWVRAIVRASPSIGALCRTELEGDIPLRCQEVRRPTDGQGYRKPASSSAGTAP